MTPDRELAFHGAMVDLYLRAKREANYNATYFLQMISDAAFRGYRTARQLIHRGGLDPAVEAVIHRPEWADLFPMRSVRSRAAGAPTTASMSTGSSRVSERTVVGRDWDGCATGRHRRPDRSLTIRRHRGHRLRPARSSLPSTRTPAGMRWAWGHRSGSPSTSPSRCCASPRPARTSSWTRLGPT